MTLEQLMDDFIADALEEGWRFEELRANFDRAMREHGEPGLRYTCGYPAPNSDIHIQYDEHG